MQANELMLAATLANASGRRVFEAVETDRLRSVRSRSRRGEGRWRAADS